MYWQGLENLVRWWNFQRKQIMQIFDNWHEKIGEICKCGVLVWLGVGKLDVKSLDRKKRTVFLHIQNYLTTLYSISKIGILFGIFINKIKFNPCVNSLWMYQLIKGMDGKIFQCTNHFFPFSHLTVIYLMALVKTKGKSREQKQKNYV